MKHQLLSAVTQHVFLLLLFNNPVEAAKMDTVAVPSASMLKSYAALVVLPDSHQHSAKRYPVLYLLHGHSSHYGGWFDISTQLRDWADQHQMIIVCPDGDYDSWYIDSPVQKHRKFETFIANELVSYIDIHYKSRAEPKSRGISGVSMGGHGALYLALRHPQIYGVACSSSGVLDLLPYSGFWNLRTLLGEMNKTKDNWKKYSCYYILDGIKTTNQKIWIDCGTEDFLIELNRKFHQKLLKKNIEHIYQEYPGAHTLKYWKDAYRKQIVFIAKTFTNNP